MACASLLEMSKVIFSDALRPILPFLTKELALLRDWAFRLISRDVIDDDLHQNLMTVS